MGKEIGRSYKYNRPKSSSPTLKKPILSSSAHHTSCITISNQPVTSQPCQHQGSDSNQDKVNISNTDDIHSCVAPKIHNISVRATSTPPRLTPLITNFIKSNIQETCIISFSTWYIMYNYFKPTCYVASLSTYRQCFQSRQGKHLKYRWHPLLCNIQKT